ncbi:MAG: ABC transporter substrate-binding protein [Acidisphaera sp.]|nr:ABC transporter substrate-binding protein [Acidisphaera sp.]
MPFRLVVLVLLALWAVPAGAAEPVVVGVSGPLTGPSAQYGAQWKKGFDLALEAINGAQGGIDGRPLAYDFEDSQNDPRQSVAIAQKFVNDPRIIMELGDFSSPASMAASPIYQRAGLVQFGFTNSHPDFTKGGDYMWSNSISQADEMPHLASFAVKELGLKKLAVLHLNTDWGSTSAAIFVQAAKADGAEIVADEGYLPDERDFRSTLTRVRDSGPDGVILISYYADGALIARQARSTGLKQTFVAVSSVYSPKFIELGGDAVNGVYTDSTFAPTDPRPEVQQFVKAYRAKYEADPDTFSAQAYDTMNLVAALARKYGPTRKGMHDGLMQISDVPSVVYGRIKFDPQTRRVAGARSVDLLVQNGVFTVWKPHS